MILDLWFALGGVLGALIRRYRAKDEGNALRLYLVDAAVAALGGPLLSGAASAVGFGQDLLATLNANPVRAIAVGAIPAYVGLDLLTMTSERWRGKPSAENVKEIVVASKPSMQEAQAISKAATTAAVDPPA